MRGWKWLQRLLAKPESVVATVAVPEPAPASPPPPVKARTARKPAPTAPSGRGRPVSNSLTRTIELLRANAELTPQELAAALPVSRDYARTLLRRARTQIQPEAPPTPKRPVLTIQNPEPEAPANNRAQVLRRASKGECAQAIAANLGIPAGEVDFILKVERLLESAR